MSHLSARHPRLALVVDDEVELLDVLKAVLTEEADFRVITAAAPELVVPLVEAASPEVLLLDVGLPRQSGGEVLAALRQIPRFANLPVLIVSAARDAGKRVAELNDPWVEFLAKPVDLDTLLERVEGLVKRRSQERATQ